jgi:hypothetical protein
MSTGHRHTPVSSRAGESRASASLAFDLDNLTLDVFEISDDGLAVESLTGAHGMTELRASACCIRLCSGSCCCFEEEAAPSGLDND